MVPPTRERQPHFNFSGRVYVLTSVISFCIRSLKLFKISIHITELSSQLIASGILQHPTLTPSHVQPHPTGLYPEHSTKTIFLPMSLHLCIGHAGYSSYLEPLQQA